MSMDLTGLSEDWRTVWRAQDDLSIQGDGYRTLEEGDRVTFEVTKGPKGLQAANVERA